MLPVRPATATAPAAGGHLPSHMHVAPSRHKAAEKRLASMLEAREGGDQRASLLEAGAHLFLAEELRVAASLLSDGAADPRVAAERLLELADAMQVEACKQRHDKRVDDADAYGGGYSSVVAARHASVTEASRAASSMHRSSQLRHAATAIFEYAQALRHGGARGWTTAYGDGGFTAAHPTVIPTLLMLADNETALARARARPSRPGAADHAHAALDAAIGAADEARGGSPPLHPPPPWWTTSAADVAAELTQAAYAPGGTHAPTPATPPKRSVARAASSHARRRLTAAGDDLVRGASLVADASSLLPPPPPDTALVAARALASGGRDSHSYKWRRSRRGLGCLADADAWGSTVYPQHGGNWLGAGWLWRDGHDGYASSSSEDSEAEEERANLVRFRKAKRALKAARRLCKHHHPEGGVCVRCIERDVEQLRTPAKGHQPWGPPDGIAESLRWEPKTKI